MNACIICGKNKYEKITVGHDRLCSVDGYFTIWKCLECGLYSTDPKLSFDEMTEYYGIDYPIYGLKISYPEQNLIVKSWFINRQREKVIDFLARISYKKLLKPSLLNSIIYIVMSPFRMRARGVIPYLENPARLLDIGCGAGNYLYSAHKRGWDCFGTEISSETTAILINRRIAKIQNCSFEKSVYEERQFDVINMSHVLEHMADPIIALQKVNMILKDEGLLFINIPCVTLEAIILGSFWMGWDIPRHYYHFTRSTIIKTLKQTNFEVISLVSEHNSNNLIWALKLLLENNRATKKLSRYISIQNRLLQIIFWPIETLIWLARQSDRLRIIAKKKNE
jgi:2-polyprenyl-3-methyl-5-hydroxy-6-metoxy-1,4-benzoquinol methylase